jgi:hypothetical protein
MGGGGAGGTHVRHSLWVINQYSLEAKGIRVELKREEKKSNKKFLEMSPWDIITPSEILTFNCKIRWALLTCELQVYRVILHGSRLTSMVG